MTDDEFLLAFEACTIPRSEWTHEAHVRMAWLYLSRRPFTEALDRIRRGIRKLNDRIGQPPITHRAPDFRKVHPARLQHERRPERLSRDDHGRPVADHRRPHRPDEDFAAFRAGNPDLLDRKLPGLFRHYSPALLWSPEARGWFVEPDLIELPEIPPTSPSVALDNQPGSCSMVWPPSC